MEYSNNRKLIFFDISIIYIIVFSFLILLSRSPAIYQQIGIQIDQYYSNYPNLQLISSVFNPNTNITLTWIDSISPVNFSLSLYSDYMNSTILNLNRDSGNLSFILKNSTSITYAYTNIQYANYGIKVYLNQTKIARFKIIYNYGQIYYGIYEPPSLNMQLFPFKIIDDFNCSFQIKIRRMSYFLNQTKLIKPNQNPLNINSGTLTNIANQAPIFSQGLKGQWYIKIQTNYTVPGSPQSISIDQVTMYKNIAQNSCSLTCYNSYYLYQQNLKYNNIIDKCQCTNQNQIYDNQRNCYVDCSSTKTTDYVDVNPLKIYLNENYRCQCSNSSLSFNRLICSLNCIQLSNIDPYLNDYLTVPQGCVCRSGFYWDSIQRICLINCTMINHTANQTTRYNSETCFCADKYGWDYVSKTCRINCSAVLNSKYKNRIYLTDTSCTCKDNWTWNQTTVSCDIICSYGTIDPLNNTRCNCFAGYIFNVSSQRCERDCVQNFAFAIGANQTDITQCICQKTHIWDINLQACLACQEGDSTICCSPLTNLKYSLNYQGCIPNCSRSYDPFAVGVNQTQINQCECDFMFRWSYSLKRCVRDCSRLVDRYATGVNTTNPTNYSQCSCDANFVWSTTLNKCIRNCAIAVDPRSSGGVDLINVGKCNCTVPFVWNFEESKCTRNCSRESDKYSVGLNPNNMSACLCDSGLTWRLSDSKCFRNCTVSTALNQTFITGNSTVDLGECLCAVGYNWSGINKVCVKDCSTDVYATFINIDNPTECRCVAGFGWDLALKKCARKCGANQPDPYSVSLKTGSVTECTCASGFVWRTADGHCVRNCSKLTDIYTTGTSILNISQCGCLIGFYYNLNQLKCMRNCSIDPHSIGIKMSNFGQCVCENNYYWRSTDNKCVRNCSKEYDPYATGTNPSNISQCLCILNCVWNSSVNACQPNASYINPLAKSYTPMTPQTYTQTQAQQETQIPSQSVNSSLTQPIVQQKLNLNKQNLEIEQDSQNMDQIDQSQQQQKSERNANTLMIVLGVLGGIMTVLLFGSIGWRLLNKKMFIKTESENDNQNKENRKIKKIDQIVSVGSASSKNIVIALENQNNI